MSRRHLIAPVVVMLFLFCAESPGALIQPPGLNPGDQFRFIFVTSGVTDATSSTIGTYDDFVKDAATSAGLTYLGTPVSWEALVSTAGTSAVSRLPLGDSVPIYRLDGVQVATGSTQLFTTDTNLSAEINVDEEGNSPTTNLFAWTGTAPSGAVSIEPVGSDPATAGFINALNDNWVDNLSFDSSDRARLYGYSGILQVPFDNQVIPEPGSIMLCLLGLGAMVGVRCAKRRRKNSSMPGPRLYQDK